MLGKLVHPGPTARRGKTRRHSGFSRKEDASFDSNRRLCAQCGFENDITQINVGDSDGSLGLVTTAVELNEGGTTSKVEAQRTQGCRFCGSLNVEGRNRFSPASMRTRGTRG